MEIFLRFISSIINNQGVAARYVFFSQEEWSANIGDK
jgi:hypothetical protein